MATWTPGVTTGAEMAADFNASEDRKKHGIFDYNDAATAITPLVVSGGGAAIKLTNDAAGPFTNKLYKPDGVTDVWNTTTNNFDFSQLTLGSKVHYRLDVTVTISGTNAELNIDLILAVGGFSYTLTVDREYFKSAGTYNITIGNFIYMGDSNTVDNGGHFEISGSNNMDVVVNGWACYLTLY